MIDIFSDFLLIIKSLFLAGLIDILLFLPFLFDSCDCSGGDDDAK